MNRRDLIKFFGAGTLIAPIAGSEPIARLIEVPKVELVQAARMPEPIAMKEVRSVSVSFEMADGSRRALRSKVLIQKRGVIDPRDIPEVWISLVNTSCPLTKYDVLGAELGIV